MSTIAIDRSLEGAASVFTRQSRYRMLVILLVVCDVLALLGAFGLAYMIRFNTDIPIFEDVQPSLELYLRFVAPMTLGWILTLAAFRLYDVQNLLGGTKEYASIFHACAVATCLLILITFFVPVVRLSRGAIVLTWLLTTLILECERFAIRRVVYRLRRRGIFMSRTVIVGTDGEAHAIAQQLQSTPTMGAHVLGFVTASHVHDPKQDAAGVPVVGTLQTLPQIAERLGVDELIVSTANLSRENLLAIFQNFANSERVALRFSSGLYELFTTGVSVKELGNVPLVSMNKVRLDELETFVKTLMDKLIAFAALVLLSPLFFVIAVCIKYGSKGPVIHRRRVLGRGGQEFDAFKFRTMYINGAEILNQYPELARELEMSHKIKEDPRITPVGRWLRRFSLDELPQLFNILRGQMSLVGPRMITQEEAAKYGQWRLNLLTVKPGLTGLWQIKGRSDVPYDERVRLDMYYIRNYSIWMDVHILFRTVPVVLSGKGAY